MQGGGGSWLCLCLPALQELLHSSRTGSTQAVLLGMAAAISAALLLSSVFSFLLLFTVCCSVPRGPDLAGL